MAGHRVLGGATVLDGEDDRVGGPGVVGWAEEVKEWVGEGKGEKGGPVRKFCLFFFFPGFAFEFWSQFEGYLEFQIRSLTQQNKRVE